MPIRRIELRWYVMAMNMFLMQARTEKSAGRDAAGRGRPRRFARWRRRLLIFGFTGLLLVYGLGLLINFTAGGLKGMNVASQMIPADPRNVRILFDVTAVDADGERVAEHEIFDALLAMIEQAESEIVLDMFLINRFRGDGSVEFFRDTSRELVEALVARLGQRPDLFVLFVTDMINSGYEVACPPVLESLRQAGGHVVLTDLHQLPDSNFVYSPFYRVLRHLAFLMGPVPDYGFLPNPFDREADKFGLRQLARMLNFKANHRKMAAVRRADGRWLAMVSSANPHSASSAHGNVAVVLEEDGPIGDMVQSEYDIARASLLRRPELYFGPGSAMDLVRELELRPRDWPAAPAPYEGEDRVMVQYLSELELARRLDRMLAEAEVGDRVEMMMFYLADPKVVEGLRQAAERGARVRLLLDPNKDAFGRRKHGVPNRVVATQLHRWAQADEDRDLQIRWAATHGEQAHFKILRVVEADSGRQSILLGSANFTIRNLRGQNLESAVYLEGGDAIGLRFEQVFERMWNNRDGLLYTLDFDSFRESGASFRFKQAMKFIGNTFGLCTY